MSDFIDARRFPDEESMFSYIIEQIVKPRLREALGPEREHEEVSGIAWVFGGPGPVAQEVLQSIQERINTGLNPDYVISEWTDLAIRRTRESKYRGLTIRYIELAKRQDEVESVEALSAEELEERWRLSGQA